MNGIWITGLGAVTPAGWKAEDLWKTIHGNKPVPDIESPRPGWEHALKCKRVPTMDGSGPSFLRHPRLRRSSPISQYILTAAFEALTQAGALMDETQVGRLGVVFVTTCGSVIYSRRFYQEVLDNPAMASPMLFPETVFNAPASHLSSVLNSSTRNYTLVGDTGTVAQALSMAAHWLMQGLVEGCLVVAAEEADWLIGDVLRHFSKQVTLSEGAGALYLTRGDTGLARLIKTTTQHGFEDPQGRFKSLHVVMEELAPVAHGAVLSCGLCGNERSDRAERLAWEHWSGERIAVKRLLGEAFAAGAMWQCVAGIQALNENWGQRAYVSIPGNYQFAVGLEFSR